jgi:hypothetical protein
MAHRRTITTAVLVAALGLGAASCRGDEDPGDDPGAQPTPTTSAATSATPTPTETTSPTPDPEAWRAKFTKDQLTAFDRALQVWNQYGELTERYRRDPVDRETAQDLFEKYTHNATALTASYEANFINGGVRQLSAPTALTWTGRKIELNSLGGLVEFDQCTDYTTLDIERDGKPIADAAPTKNPTAILRVQMDSDAKGNWRLLESKVVDKPCA